MMNFYQKNELQTQSSAPAVYVNKSGNITFNTSAILKLSLTTKTVIDFGYDPATDTIGIREGDTIQLRKASINIGFNKKRITTDIIGKDKSKRWIYEYDSFEVGVYFFKRSK